jgi:small GTP-binding protein
MSKNISIKDRNIRIQIWDTAGQEAYRSITRSYYKSSTCAFIVYDITEKKTFDDVDIWLRDCRDICYKNVLIYLIGNKSDLEDKRQVTFEEGKQYAEENNLVFFETSALNGSNIEEIFIQSATDLVNKLESGELNNDLSNSGIKVFQYPNKGIEDKMLNKKKGCC